MAALGFSVNMLTLFGLVLAIGIVVDDAIVIVENAAHHIDRGGLAPKTATIQAMSEVIGPVIGITLVLMAVFLPTAFLGGITGQLYRQFALTIAATALISAINAVTLKPAQCAVYLRPTPSGRTSSIRAFNASTTAARRVYAAIVRRVVRHAAAMMLAVRRRWSALTGWWFTRLPTGFFPTEDQGYAIVGVQLPDAASQARTRAVVEQGQRDPQEDARASTAGSLIGGSSILDGAVASNAATLLRHVHALGAADRPPGSEPGRDPRRTSRGSSARSARRWSSPSRRRPSRAWASPAASRCSSRTAAASACAALQQVVDEMVRDGNAQIGPERRCRRTFRAGVPQLYADVDRDEGEEPGRAARRRLRHAAGVARLGLRQRLQQVRPHLPGPRAGRPAVPARARGHPPARGPQPRRARWSRSARWCKVEKRLGPQIIPRYNLYPSASITGEAAPGYSSGQALQAHGADGGQEAAGVDGLRVDRHVVPGEAGRLAGALRRSRWPCCWSTWCWPPSTRAGSCPRR